MKEEILLEIKLPECNLEVIKLNYGFFKPYKYLIWYNGKSKEFNSLPFITILDMDYKNKKENDLIYILLNRYYKNHFVLKKIKKHIIEEIIEELKHNTLSIVNLNI